jgi:hypothetical protein
VKVLATYNIKGGVGKTATAVNLAWLAARDGLRTVLWDLDPQAAATFYFRIDPRVKGGGGDLVRRKPISLDSTWSRRTSRTAISTSPSPTPSAPSGSWRSCCARSHPCSHRDAGAHRNSSGSNPARS